MGVVDRPGFEPGTSRMPTERSSRLSYRPSTLSQCHSTRTQPTLYKHYFGIPESRAMLESMVIHYVSCIVLYSGACQEALSAAIGHDRKIYTPLVVTPIPWPPAPGGGAALTRGLAPTSNNQQRCWMRVLASCRGHTSSSLHLILPQREGRVKQSMVPYCCYVVLGKGLIILKPRKCLHRLGPPRQSTPNIFMAGARMRAFTASPL